jgi:signal transduction histidine kinase
LTPGRYGWINRGRKVRMHMSLRTRFMVSVIVLLICLVGLILFAIEKREVKAIFEEQKEKGWLMAGSIAQLNLQPLLYWDKSGIEENLEGQIDDKLLYVVIYDRNNKPYAANEFIKDYDEIFQTTGLTGDEGQGSCSYVTKEFEDRRSNQTIPVLEIETPIYAKGSPRRWGAIKIGLSLVDMRQEMFKTRLVLILIGVGGIVIGAVGASLLARRIVRPIKKLAEGTVNIARGDFSQKIEIDAQDEIGDLAQNFNQMSHRLQMAKEREAEAQKKLIQAEKLASIGRIAAGIAHEIRNPLTSVKLNIQKVLEGDNIRGVEKDHLDISQEGIGQIENFVKELLNFTRVSTLNRDWFYVEHVMEESVKMIAGSLEKKRVRLTRDFQAGLPQVYVDADRLRQVFLNILRNACEAVENGGRIALSLSHKEGGPGRYISIEISDNGSGIEEKDGETIFEPFYTTKSSGIGLGLANARKIIEQHKGSIRVKKKEGKGACFEILIPCGEET